MSFEFQSVGHCGVASVRYALSLLGHGLRNNKELTEADVRRAFGKTWTAVASGGVDEGDIVRAAKKLGLQARIHRRVRSDPARFVEILRERTALGHPVVMTVHDDAENHFHWICVGGFSPDGEWAFVFDPSLLDAGLGAARFRLADKTQERVPGLMRRRRLEQWLEPGVVDAHDAQYGIELWPTASARRRFVPGAVDTQLFEDMRRDDELVSYFDDYIDDLRDIFAVGSPTDRSPRAFDFLTNHADELFRLCRGWALAEAVDDAFFRLEIAALAALCRCYDFRVPPDAERATLVSLGIYLGWRSAERAHEVGRYGAVSPL